MQQGYTLPEVLIAMALVGVMLAALMAAFTTSTVHSTLAQEDLRATQILLEKLEVVRSYTWNQLFPNIDPDESDEDDGETFDPTDPDYPQDDIPFTVPKTFTAPFVPGATNNGGFSYSGTISVTRAPVDEAYSNSLAQIVIAVTWNSGTGQHSREMRSLFAEYGLQNNITR